MSSETVWRCLNECDISGAMIASLSALFILRKSAEKEHSSLPILKFLLLASRHANVKMQVKPNIRKQLTDASSLTEV